MKLGRKLVFGALVLALVACGESVQAGSPAYRVGHSHVKASPIGHAGGCGCDTKGGLCGAVPDCGNICRPCLIPAVLQGVENLLDRIFTCATCCDSGCSGKSCAGPKYRTPSCLCSPLLKSTRCNKGPSCGCGSGKVMKGGGGYSVPMHSPADPFIDDELTPPPVPMTETRAVRKSPAKVPAPLKSARNVRSAPRAVSVVSVKPVVRPKSTVSALSQVSGRVVRANNEQEVVPSAPANPLR